MTNSIKQEFNKIEIPLKIDDMILLGVDRAKAEMGLNKTKVKKRKWSIGRKIGYFSGAAVLIMGLIVGSGFISPAMAKVVFKIPLLDHFDPRPSISDGMAKALKDKRYKVEVQEVVESLRKHHFNIFLHGSESYYNEKKAAVKRAAVSYIDQNGYDQAPVYVKRYVKNAPDPEQMKREKDMQQFLGKLRTKFEQKNYDLQTFGLQYNGPKTNNVTLRVEVPNTEKRTAEIKKDAEEILKASPFKSYSIKIESVDLAEKKKESQWSGFIIPSIANALIEKDKDQYKVSGVGYSYRPNLVRIIVSTHLAESDPQSKELGKNIADSIEAFLKTDEAVSRVGHQQHQIIVYSKEKGKIN